MVENNYTIEGWIVDSNDPSKHIEKPQFEVKICDTDGKAILKSDYTHDGFFSIDIKYGDFTENYEGHEIPDLQFYFGAYLDDELIGSTKDEGYRWSSRGGSVKHNIPVDISKISKILKKLDSKKSGSVRTKKSKTITKEREGAKVLKEKSDIAPEKESKVVDPEKKTEKPVIKEPAIVPSEESKALTSEKPETEVSKSIEPSSLPLEALAENIRLELPHELLAKLGEHSIYTLDDIRKAGGISRIEGIRADSSVVRTLEAHADLSRVSSDMELNSRLINKGYTSILSIANTPRSDFVAAVHEDVGDFRAAKMHIEALAQTKFLNNMLTGLRADLANNYVTAKAVDQPNILEALPRRCACKDCEAAVSPLAYLADLMDYVLNHLKRDINGLKGEYYQSSPLSGYPINPARVFASLKLTRTDTQVDFSWSASSPDPSIPPDFFAVKWTGQLEPRFSETYTFYTISDDGVKLWVNDQLVIDKWMYQNTPTENIGTITLIAGKRYEIKLEFFEAQGGATMKLLWSSPSQVKEVIPQSQLYTGVSESVDLQFLADTFHQPFDKMPVSCEMSEKEIRQVRLCIEVLRSYLRKQTNIVGEPVALLTDSEIQVYARRIDDHLLEFHKEKNHLLWQISDLSAITGARIDGNPTVLLTGQAVHIYVRGSDDRLLEFYKEPNPTPWKVFQTSADTAIAGDPSVLLTGQAVHIYVRGSSDRLLEFYKEPNPAPWKVFQTSADTAIAGDPSVLLIGQAVHIYVRGSGDRLLEFYKEPNPAPWKVFQTSADTAIVGDPSVLLTGQAVHIYVRGSGDRLLEFYKEPNPAPWKVFQTSADTAIASDPSVLLTGQAVHIYVRGSDDRLLEFYKEPNPALWEVFQTSATAVAGDPSVLLTGQDIHVYMRGVDGRLLEFYKAPIPEPWLCLDVYKITDIPSEKEYRLAAYTVLLTRIGTSFEEIRLTRNADDKTRKALADRIGIDLYDIRPDNLDALFLNPVSVPEVLTEKKLGEIFGLRDTHQNSLTNMETPYLEKWRLNHLRILWKEQDWPRDPYSEDFTPAEGRLPIIDPDIIGPDDFRHPISSNPVFALWELRRKWVDSQIQELSGMKKNVPIEPPISVPDLDAMFVRMYKPVNYPRADPTATKTPWANTTPVAEFDDLFEKLTGGTADEVKNAKERIEGDLSLMPEAFSRIMAIRTKDKLWENDKRNEAVKDDEWRDIYSILVQAQKARFFATWITEENSANIRFGPKEFWISLHEPIEGDWPPTLEANIPLIDPDAVKLNELPEVTAGKEAIRRWKTRRGKIEQVAKDLKKAREDTGFDAMLTMALDDPSPAEPLPQYMARLNKNIQDGIDVEKTKKEIKEKLFMEAEELSRVLLARSKSAGGKTPPTSAEYAEIYAILTQAQKKRELFPVWIAEDKALVYWSALKARLPRWRASTEARQQWKQALLTRSSRPLIDPDLIGPGDLKNPVRGDSAFDLWNQRYTQIGNWIANFKSTPAPGSSADRFKAVIEKSELGLKIDDLVYLDNERKLGNDITSRLEQLSLDNAAFQYLLSIRDLAEGNQPILNSEWDQVYSILTQINKDGEFANWREGEKASSILLSGDFFGFPEVDKNIFPPQPVWEPVPWRSTWEERNEWQDTLQSRIDQEKTVIEALQEAVSAAEEATLPMLRDALIMAVDKGGNNLDSRAKWVTDHLLIDAKAGGCQMITRVSQAIETIQNLLWSIRTGQLEDTYPDLVLVAPNFDEEWQWIGSYATWRAAMFVFMYPENILIPSLRKHQTPSFSNLVTGIRSNQRLTAEQACIAGRAYYDYFKDVCNLLEEACVEQVPTRIHSKDCQSNEEPLNRNLSYFIARSTVSNKVYWCTRDTNLADASYAQTFWDEVPGLNGGLKLIGAIRYEPSTNERFIYLFAQTHEKGQQKLVFTKYDLENGKWDQEATELKLPQSSGNTTQFWAKLKQTQLTEPPRLGIWYSDDDGYTQQLNLKGDDWAGDKFEALIIAKNYGTLMPILKSVLDKACGCDSYPVNGRFFAVNRYLGVAHDKPPEPPHYIGGFPTFHEDGGNPGDPGFGIVFLTEETVVWRDLDKDADLKDPQDEKQRILSVNSYARDNGYAGGFPNFEQGMHDDKIFYGSFLVKADAAEFRQVLRKDLQDAWDPDANLEDIADRFRSVNSYATSNGFLGGFPTFIDNPPYIPQYPIPGLYLGVVLIKKSFKTVKGLEPYVPICQHSNIKPVQIDNELFAVAAHNPSNETLQRRRQKIKEAFLANWQPQKGRKWPGNRSNLSYLEEAFYFVPMQIALALQQRGQYIAALDWLRTVYDYSAPLDQRKIWYGLTMEESLQETTNRADNWLLDPLNPHLIAETRRNSYTLYTLFSLIRCFLEYADAEFTRDTAESVPLARDLYMTALELMDMREVKQGMDACEDLISTLDIQVRNTLQVDAPQWLPSWIEVKKELVTIPYSDVLGDAVKAVSIILSDGSSPWDMRLKNAMEMIHTIEKEELPPTPTFADLLEANRSILVRAHSMLMAKLEIAESSVNVGALAGQSFLQAVSRVSGLGVAVLEQEKVTMQWLRTPTMVTGDHDIGVAHGAVPLDILTSYAPAISSWFCFPPNPVLKAVKMHAELNLFKLQHCRNISGMQRQLEPYAAPTDITSGLPTIGAGGQLILPGTIVLRPTPYRYSVVIERAKQLVQIAAQIEAAMLSALEKHDAEAYQLLKARQDVRMASAGVRLQNLRVTEARDSTTLATLQRNRAQFQIDNYEKWIQEGLTSYEQEMLGWYTWLGIYQGAAVIAQGALTAITQPGLSPWLIAAYQLANAQKTAADILAINAQVSINRLSILASQERRRQEWEFQKELAMQDVQIGNQQITIAEDHERVVGQELVIAELQRDHAEAIVEFLSNKFTNVELYHWMSDILGRVYAFFLQQATSMAKLAENQLAFEKHETPPSYIQADYWEAPTDQMIGGTDGSAPDRRGLTGSARLLQDIYQLDQYAFEINKRKLQLTKTISLAQLSPAEFQRFREIGVMNFRTSMERFDYDFPGHYLRLIKRVRTSVIALIPPTQGIHATLATTSGISRVVIGPDVFQTEVIRRDPESVAFTTPSNATGLFELEPQSEMLFPFEAIGVDTSWEFRMPKAANLFDYSTIADVLITIEYTALDSFDYRQQVIQQLDSKISADRPFSFRNQFADQWYDLHNPDQTSTPMVVRFSTRREDFPPNIEDLKIQQVVLYFARAEGKSFELPVSGLTFTDQSGGGRAGGSATSIDGIISTRRGNASSWISMIGKTPIGEWELALPDNQEIRNLFKKEEIEDILLVITYLGRTPEWPA